VQQATRLEEEQLSALVDRVQDLTGGANSSEMGGMEDDDEGNADQTEEAKKDEVKDIVEEATKDGENEIMVMDMGLEPRMAIEVKCMLDFMRGEPSIQECQ
jgi:hypothetical protein